MIVFGRLRSSKGYRWRHRVAFRPVVIPAAIMISALIYYLASLAPHTSGIDDTIYVLMATAISRGEFLHAIHVVGAPLMQYQIGLPVLLAPLISVFPEFPANLPIVQLVPLVFAVASLPLIYRIIGQTTPYSFAPTLITIWTAVNYAASWYWTRVVMTEAIYLFFSLLALVLVLKISQSKDSWLIALIAGLSISAAYYARTVGVSLALAAVIWLLFRRQWRATFVVSLGFGLTQLPMMLYERTIDTSLAADFYGQQFLLRDFWHPERGVIEHPLELVVRLFNNILGHSNESLPLLFFPTLTGENVYRWLSNHNLAWLPSYVGLSLIFVIIAGVFVRLRRIGLGLIDLYFGLYILMILAPPWVTYRNLIPVLPLIGLYVLEACAWLGNTAFAAVHARSPRVFIAVSILAVSLLSNGISARHNLLAGIEFRAQGLAFRSPEASVTEAATWIRHHTPADSIVYFRSPEEMYLRTGRLTVPTLASNLPMPIGLRPLEDVISILKSEVDFVTVVESEEDWQPLIRRAINEDPSVFEPVFRTQAAPPVTVYRVVRIDNPMYATNDE